MANATPNHIYDADEHRLKFDQCAWGSSGGVDPSGRLPGSGSSFGVSQINRMIRILRRTNARDDLTPTEGRDHYNYRRTYHVQEIPVSDCAFL